MHRLGKTEKALGRHDSELVRCSGGAGEESSFVRLFQDLTRISQYHVLCLPSPSHPPPIPSLQIPASIHPSPVFSFLLLKQDHFLIIRKYIISSKQEGDEQIFTNYPYLGLKILCLRSFKIVAVISVRCQKGLPL